MEAAGGIGGLLAVCDPDDPCDPADTVGDFVYTYDANGNVGQLIDGTPTSWDAGTVMVARYEYDPYGKGTQSAGRYAAANPFRFSTKYFDDETGLGAWIYRYYSPSLGRWISRDPIGERGGLNLYTYAENCPLTQVDPGGLSAQVSISVVNDQQHRGHINTTITADVRAPSKCDHVHFAQLVLYEAIVYWGVLGRSTSGALDNSIWLSPWYTEHIDGPAALFGNTPGQRWTMYDNPGLNGSSIITSLTQEFETCAICRKGRQLCLLGCTEWGHTWVKGATPASDFHSWYGFTTSAPTSTMKLLLGKLFRLSYLDSADDPCGCP